MPDFKDLDGPIEKLNRMPPNDRRASLLSCCGSTRWAEEVSGLLPMWDVGQLLILGERVWRELGREDWLEAFRAHPKIGERRAAAPAGEDARRWSEGEQSRARATSTETLDALSQANREYEEKFGFILRARMRNDAETELRVAAEEQWRITELRIKKLLDV